MCGQKQRLLQSSGCEQKKIGDLGPERRTGWAPSHNAQQHAEDKSSFWGRVSRTFTDSRLGTGTVV